MATHFPCLFIFAITSATLSAAIGIRQCESLQGAPVTCDDREHQGCITYSTYDYHLGEARITETACAREGGTGCEYVEHLEAIVCRCRGDKCNRNTAELRAMVREAFFSSHPELRDAASSTTTERAAVDAAAGVGWPLWLWALIGLTSLLLAAGCALAVHKLTKCWPAKQTKIVKGRKQAPSVPGLPKTKKGVAESKTPIERGRQDNVEVNGTGPTGEDQHQQSIHSIASPTGPVDLAFHVTTREGEVDYYTTPQPPIVYCADRGTIYEA